MALRGVGAARLEREEAEEGFNGERELEKEKKEMGFEGGEREEGEREEGDEEGARCLDLISRMGGPH